MAGKSKRAGAGAGSDTHLDVYKRQVFDVDSEEGCGTTVMIKIPETYL